MVVGSCGSISKQFYRHAFGTGIYSYHSFGGAETPPPPGGSCAGQVVRFNRNNAFNSLVLRELRGPVVRRHPGRPVRLRPGGAGQVAAEQRIWDVGLRPVRLGDLNQVGLVDAVGGLWFALAFGQGMRRQLAFKVLTR